ncbi:MAG: creatininase family protein [Pseudomonadota bacterium]
MLLAHSTWLEVEAYLEHSDGIILPVGSTEQHGPIGLIGTDTICTEEIALRAGEAADALVAPALGWTPAPFNMSFPGTISITPDLFADLAGQIVDGLVSHGFRHVYLLNGHGANLEPLRSLAATRPQMRIRSWWDFDAVNAIRRALYGSWEGMRATPAEVAITQATRRTVQHPLADEPPEPIDAAFIAAHAGDRHGPPVEHRAAFPDGRVGSHSALATPEAGQRLLAAAVEAVIEDYRRFVAKDGTV